MISKRWMQRAFTVAVVCVSCSIFFCSEICSAKTAAKTTKVHTYKEGFTYQKLDSETIARMRGKSYKKGAKIPLSRLRTFGSATLILMEESRTGKWSFIKRLPNVHARCFMNCTG